MIPVDLLLACALDAAIGDPRWLPHPVRAMGQLAGWFEKGIRCLHPGPRALRLAGIALAFALPCLAFSTGWILIAGGKSIHDWVGRGIAICLACSTLAWRDLVGHVSTVERSLKAGYLTEARKAVSQIVGRDTEGLSEREVVRATIETTAESLSDGIVAPLLYLAVGGASLALAYKVVSTLDSMIGHRDEQYKDFGWASAKLDDVLNWIPSRLTAWLIVLMSGTNSGAMNRIVRTAGILFRDGHKHPSPNSGHPEAAMAGALGVQLGGINLYDGVPHELPRLGDDVETLSLKHIDRAKCMTTTVYLVALTGTLIYLW